MVTRRTVVKSTVAVPFAGGALLTAIQPGSIAAQDLTINVGSKDFTEQFILGHMYINILEDMGITAEDNTNLGGTQIAHQALESGEIHLYPEYTGTGLTEVLGLSVDEVLAGNGATPEASPVAEDTATPVAIDASQAVFDTVKAAYQEQFGLVWLERSPANNTRGALSRSRVTKQG